MSVLTPHILTAACRESDALSPEMASAFRAMIYSYFRAHPRLMPWRESRDPYKILVSELMLQQTQVDRVVLKYAEFLSAFPTVQALAAAPLVDVLHVWQGLGYNRRAIFLKRCAIEIVGEYGGRFPETVADLQALPGIGPYTARAVAAFAFNIAEPLIETNIRTVYIHFFFHDCDAVSDHQIMPLIAATLDGANPREWYYALMDYGAMLKQVHPNPGRRSRHHVSQSRFEGSNRQLRSRLLRVVMAQPGVSLVELVAALTAEKQVIVLNLEALQKEGFLKKQGGGYCVSA